MLATQSADTVDATEAECRAFIIKALESLGLGLDALPLDTDDTAELLAALGYDMTPDLLREIGERGQVPAIAAWDAKDIVAAAGACEGRRQWRLTPCAHDPKKTETRLLLERAMNAGPDAVAHVREHLKGFDLRLALCLLAEAESRQVRERMLTNIELILLADYGVQV